MKFINDRVLKDMNINLYNEFGKETAKKILELEKKVDELAQKLEKSQVKRSPGRPRKTDG